MERRAQKIGRRSLVDPVKLKKAGGNQNRSIPPLRVTARFFSADCIQSGTTSAVLQHFSQPNGLRWRSGRQSGSFDEPVLFWIYYGQFVQSE